jgi:menaquinone-dependent protoporphyrinogen oxidase
MNVLMLYGTTEGQTQKVAGFVADRLRQLGDEVTVMDASTVEWDFWLGAFDAAIIAASVHGGRYRPRVVQFAQCHFERLNQMPSLFLSVSLSAATPNDEEGMESIRDCADAFTRETGWKAKIEHIAGAFRFTEYDFFKRWVMRLIAWEKGAKRKSGDSDLELTDWHALGTIIDEFHESALKRLATESVSSSSFSHDPRSSSLSGDQNGSACKPA